VRSARAAVFEGVGRPLGLRELPLADPVPGGFLARVHLSTVCGSDLHAWLGRRSSPVPGILGHEIVGTVAAVPPEPPRCLDGEPLRVGDRVTWTEYVSCGRCVACTRLGLPQKCTNVRKYGHEGSAGPPHLLGGFAEYCHVLPGTGVLRVPDALSDAEAAPLNCGVATVAAVVEAAAIEAGETVVVLGAGLLGLYAVAMACVAGAETVVAIDAAPARLGWAARFGATCAILPAELADVHDADVLIEICGAGAALAPGLATLRVGGRVVLAGLVAPDPAAMIDGHDMVRRCLTVRGVHNYMPRHLIQAAEFVTAHRTRLPLGDLVDVVVPLDEAQTALRLAAERRALRPAVRP
jgi:putative phosphonate catabolism associated alcohol dehydrogenase